MREWFAQLVLYSQTLTLSGIYSPFGELGVGALRMVSEIHGKSIRDSDVTELRDRMGAMPAHPDVVPGLIRLRDAGFRLVTLTNSAPASSPTPLERAGLGGFFEQNFSVESVRRFKPAPETYTHVATELGVETSALCLVACHLWDTIGAQSLFECELSMGCTISAVFGSSLKGLRSGRSAAWSLLNACTRGACRPPQRGIEQKTLKLLIKLTQTGSQTAGCLGALLTRPHNAFLPAAGVPRPDLIAPDLGDLARQIFETWPPL